MTTARSFSRSAAERVPFDAYYTPPGLADAIVARLDEIFGVPDVYVEPSCGSGNFVAAMRARHAETPIVAVDSVPEACLAAGQRGATKTVISAWEHTAAMNDRGLDESMKIAVVGNPPYTHAAAHVIHAVQGALAIGREGSYLAFLLKLMFYESDKRIDFWRALPERYLIPIQCPRPIFGLNRHGKPGSDGQAYCVMVWTPGYRGNGERLPGIVWKP